MLLSCLPNEWSFISPRKVFLFSFINWLYIYFFLRLLYIPLALTTLYHHESSSWSLIALRRAKLGIFYMHQFSYQLANFNLFFPFAWFLYISHISETIQYLPFFFLISASIIPSRKVFLESLVLGNLEICILYCTFIYVIDLIIFHKLNISYIYIY